MIIYINGIIYSLQKDGGVSRYTNEIINGLIKNGHQVKLLVNKNNNITKKNPNVEYIYVNSFPILKNKIGKIFTYAIHEYKTYIFMKKIKNKNAIFHSTYLSGFSGLKIPQVLTIHDLTREKFKNFFNKITNKFIILKTKRSIKNVDKIICVSQDTAKNLTSFYKTDKSKIEITHLGVDNKFTIKSAAEKEKFLKKKKITKPYILFIGKRQGYKNFNKFIIAYSKIDEKIKNNIEIITIGGGVLTKKELLLIKNLKIENSIKNFQNICEEELVMFYNCADLFIFPSFSEGFGLPIIEAMSCGIKILASNIEIFREIAKNVPFYFSPQKIDEIKNAIEISISKNETQKIEMGLKIANELKWENTINKTILIYKDLIIHEKTKI